MITVIDYGMGNIRSVVKALEKYTADVRVGRGPETISGSRALVLPGDGAFGMAMEHLNGEGWTGPLKDFIAGGGYFMGICLGYQLLFSSSEEFGFHRGLDIIPGRVVKFSVPGLKVPHMGWNEVAIERTSPFLEGIGNQTYFYFIHTYYPEIDDESWVVGSAEYGVRFPCIVGKGNLLASQFHPEKSHRMGLKIVENFVRIVCS